MLEIPTAPRLTNIFTLRWNGWDYDYLIPLSDQKNRRQWCPGRLSFTTWTNGTMSVMKVKFEGCRTLFRWVHAETFRELGG